MERINMFAVVSSVMLASSALAAVHADTLPQASTELAPIPNTVTEDIQAGIEAHIARESEQGGGFFPLSYDGKDMKLKLVRVHTEYLANLGPGRHFACVDLASLDGNVYDVDFFLEGEPGNMTVTETTVHKLNGRPFYLWRQLDDGTWVHAEVDGASQELLGVIEGSDEFEFVYHATIPQLTGNGRMWIPIPESDAFQTVTAKSINVPGTHRMLTDKTYGNKVLFIELTPSDSGKPIAMTFDVKRREKGVYVGDDVPPEQFLLPERLVPNTTQFQEIAIEALKNKRGGDLVKARALYDHTIDRMQYIKADKKYGKGDAQYACDGGSGNCTDYHSYFIALARSVGIPARFAIGAAIPSSRDDGGVNGYHCWAEFYAEGKWWPIDISEADKYTSLATYYFGHNPANRLELSRGRDLVVEPGPKSGPINFLAYPVLEVNGESIKVKKPKFGFTRKS
jgi:hypothetical protein